MGCKNANNWADSILRRFFYSLGYFIGEHPGYFIIVPVMVTALCATGFQASLSSTYSLVPKESHVTLVPHNTLIKPYTLSLKGAITLFWVNIKKKTVLTLVRIVLLSNGCAVITLFNIYLKRVMTFYQ